MPKIAIPLILIALSLSWPALVAVRAEEAPPATVPPASATQPARPAAKAPQTASQPAAQPSPKPAQPAPVASPVAQPKPEEPAPSFRNWGGTISANIPHPVFLELEHRFSPKWSAGLGAGGLSINNLMIGQIPIDLNITGVDARMRWHPWGGVFFMGLALGGQSASGSATDTIPITVNSTTVNIATKVTAQISSSYLTPHLGWFWVSKSGFTLGFDFGVQFPMNPKTTISISTDNTSINNVLDLVQQTRAYQDLQAKVQDAGDKVGGHWLPYLTVLRLGWMF